MVIRMAVRFHLRRRDPVSLVIGLYRLWRFRRAMARWDVR